MLARAKRKARRPTSDEFPADADWYAWLTEAQRYRVAEIALHCPAAMNPTAPAAMTTADGGTTYQFAGGITPLAVRIYTTWPNGRILTPSALWNAGGDYTFEGDHIRMPSFSAGIFSAGVPYAQCVTPPTVIDGSTAPTMMPDYARLVLVWDACIEWAGMDRPDIADRWKLDRNALWYPDPRMGTPGILGQLKLQNPFSGEEAFGWTWRTSVHAMLSNTGAGYRPINA